MAILRRDATTGLSVERLDTSIKFNKTVARERKGKKNSD